MPRRARIAVAGGVRNVTLTLIIFIFVTAPLLFNSIISKNVLKLRTYYT